MFPILVYIIYDNIFKLGMQIYFVLLCEESLGRDISISISKVGNRSILFGGFLRITKALKSVLTCVLLWVILTATLVFKVVS